MEYIPRGRNIIQEILQDHFSNFEDVYEKNYAEKYGKFNLDRISEAVEHFLECGDYTKGMARILCDNKDCRYDYFLPFSCKQWYLCPSCHQKRLLLFSEHLCEQTLLKLPHRQFVFTVPKMLRVFFRNDKKLFSEISKIIYSIVQDFYNEISGMNLMTGAVVSFQSYGDMMRFNPHWHCIFLEGGIDSEINFHYLSIQNTDKLTELFRQKVVKFFMDRQLLNEQLAQNLLTWKNSGFSVDNSVEILSLDKEARNNLTQYIARHPFSLKKIKYIKEKSNVLYLTKYTAYWKESIKLFSVLDFIAELTQHIPPKGKHLIRYYGIYSSRTMGKNNETGLLDKFKVRIPETVNQDEDEEKDDSKEEKNKANQTWARLIQKVFEVDPLKCPRCGGPMKIVAFITEPQAIRHILQYLEKKGLPPFDLPKEKSPPGRKIKTA